MSATVAERRKSVRRQVSLQLSVRSGVDAELIDLSEQGLRFRTGGPVESESLDIRIHPRSGRPFSVPGKVVWKNRMTAECVNYGVSFNGISLQTVRSIDDLLFEVAVAELISSCEDETARDDVEKFFSISFKRYRDMLRETDQELRDGFDREKALQRVTEWNDYIVERADKLQASVQSKLLVKRVKALFRELCGRWVYQSIIARRSFLKPRGYPGDAQIMEMIYADQPLSENIGWPCDIYFLRNPYADAVRDRKEKMRQFLESYFRQQPDVSQSRILNIACGSAREIHELIEQDVIRPDQHVQFTLVDQDSEALAIAMKTIKEPPGNIAVNYQQHNVLEYIRQSDTYANILGRQDLIYTIGLADYLPDRMLQRLLSFCLGLLDENGKLVIAHKDIDVYRPLPPDWWCDWSFYPRNEGCLLELLKGIGISEAQITRRRGDNNIILFLVIQRNVR